jgi:hypothetical protein
MDQGEKHKFQVLGVFIAAATLVSAFFVPEVRQSLGLEPSKASSESAWKLQGAWKRTDADYILHFSPIALEKFDRRYVQYFNPEPINVHSAQSEKKPGGKISIRITLRDYNYLDSQYQLEYDQQYDTLRGTYYHGELKETINVTFLRR